MAAGMKRKIADADVEISSQKSKSKSKLNTTVMAPVSNKKNGIPSGEEDVVVPSVKDLASSDPKLRRLTLQKIMAHLQSRPSTSQISSTEALQLWRGFSVALYMHDSKSAISVQNLITELAGTFDIMWKKDLESKESSDDDNDNTTTTTNSHADAPPQTVEDEEWTGIDDDNDDDAINETTAQPDNNSDSEIPDPTTTTLPTTHLTNWSTTFWTTMTREWSTIDSHRMNKYLLLVRLALRQIFTICISSKISSSTPSSPSSPSSISNPQLQLQILSLYPLHPRNSQIPNGLRLHLVDIYIDELDSALDSARRATDEGLSDEKKQEIKLKMVSPLRLMAKHGLVKVVRVRAKEELERV